MRNWLHVLKLLALISLIEWILRPHHSRLITWILDKVVLDKDV